MNKKQIIERVKKIKSSIAKDRDELHKLINELESIAEDTDEAHEDLECAVDALSRHL